MWVRLPARGWPLILTSVVFLFPLFSGPPLGGHPAHDLQRQARGPQKTRQTHDGDQQKTASVLVVSGLRSLQQWRVKEHVKIGGQDSYLDFEIVACAPRGAVTFPLDVLFWAQGLPGVSFVDLTAVANRPELVADLQSKASVRPQRLFEVLLPNAGRVPIPPSDAEAWERLVEYWQSNKLLATAMRVHLQSASAPCLVGYLVSVPAENFEKAQAQILVAAGSAEPQAFPISLELKPEESIFSSAKRFLEALFSPFVGAVAGIVLGYLAFRAQQNYLIRSEEQKKFRDNKIEQSKTLWTFFKARYDAFRNDATRDDLAKTMLIREALIEEGIYAILPPSQILRLNGICGPGNSNKGRRVEALHVFLRDNFEEFML
jgi:hypothetical protein